MDKQKLVLAANNNPSLRAKIVPFLKSGGHKEDAKNILLEIITPGSTIFIKVISESRDKRKKAIDIFVDSPTKKTNITMNVIDFLGKKTPNYNFPAFGLEPETIASDIAEQLSHALFGSTGHLKGKVLYK